MNFSSVAAGWDTPRRIARAGVIAGEIAAALEGAPHGAAMEYGCGTGLVGLCLADRFETLTLADASPGMIEALRRKVAAAGIAHVKPLVLDLTRQSAPQSYDCIFSSMVMHHVPDVAALVRCFHGLVNPCGRLCIVDLDAEDGTFHSEEPGFCGHNGFTHAEIREYLARAGFTGVKAETFYRAAKAIKGIDVAYSLFCVVGTRGN